MKSEMNAFYYHYRSGLQAFPHNAKMHYNYGNFLKDMGHKDQAINHYKEAIKWVGLNSLPTELLRQSGLPFNWDAFPFRNDIYASLEPLLNLPCH